MKFQIKLKNKEYNEAVKKRLEELGYRVASKDSMTYDYLGHYPSDPDDLLSGLASVLNPIITLNDLYTDPEKYRFKKKEKVTWYTVAYHHKNHTSPIHLTNMYKSKDSFLKDNDAEESDFHFIHLEEVCSHEY